jgi:hypothetical protein
VLLLQLAELVEDMQTVHATKCPKINNYDAASKVGKAELSADCIDPAALADQLGGADTDATGGGVTHGLQGATVVQAVEMAVPMGSARVGLAACPGPATVTDSTRVS